MNISPVSFGKIIRVNGSMEAAQKAVDLLNYPARNKNEQEKQEQLVKIFDDKGKTEAQLASLDSKTPYIFSGVDSEELFALRNDVLSAIERAGQYYGAGDLLDIEIEVQEDYHQAQLEKLIHHYADNSILNLGYDKKTNKITSVDFKA